MPRRAEVKQLNVRVPEELRERLKKLAERRNMTINDFVIEALRNLLGTMEGLT